MDIKNLLHKIALLCVELNKHHNKNMDLIETLFFSASDLGLYMQNSIHQKQIFHSQNQQKQQVTQTIITIKETLDLLVKNFYLTEEETSEIHSQLNQLL